MSKEKECDSKCGGDCGKNCTKPSDSLGSRIAREAIDELTSVKIEATDTSYSQEMGWEAEAIAFIDNCDAAGVNPLDVVVHVAKREGISLSDGSTYPSDTKEAFIKKLLMEVVKILAQVVLGVLADKYGLGIGTLIDLVKGVSSREPLRDSENGKEGIGFARVSIFNI